MTGDHGESLHFWMKAVPRWGHLPGDTPAAVADRGSIWLDEIVRLGGHPAVTIE
jgi:hypothetical protein